jgi:hypothetical protein
MPANNADEVAIENRRAKAWDLRVKGKTYREIGLELGVSHVTAWEDVKFLGERIRSETDESVEQHRAMQVQRLDKVISVLMPKVEDGDFEAMDRLDKAEKRRAALLGLDAPAKQQIDATVTGDASPAEAARLIRQAFGDHALKDESETRDTGSGDHGSLPAGPTTP